MLVTADLFESALTHIDLEGRVAVDTETTGLNPFGRDMVVGISVYVPSIEQSYYFPFRHGQGYNLPQSCMEPLLLTLCKQVWTTWNGKFDLKMLRREYLTLRHDLYPHRVEDVMLAAHLMNENESNLKLKDLSDRYAKYLGYTEAMPSASQHGLDLYLLEHGLAHKDMWRAPSEVVAPYAEQDVILTEKLRRMYEQPLRRWQLWDIWRDLGSYLIVVERMEERGIRLDQDRIHELYQECLDKADECRINIELISGVPNLNPNSAKFFKAYINAQLTAVYRMPPVDSTDAPTLEDLLDKLPEGSILSGTVEQAIKYRQWVKIGSTYYRAFLDHQYRGILHPNFHMAGTVTGRFSSGEPINMQAIPRHDDSNAGKPAYRVKESFIARPGHWLVEIDYKMAEIFIGSHIAQAKNMIAMLEKGIDVHAETAKLLGNIPRAIAKRMNFGMMYGIGPDAFVEDVKKQTGLTITRKQAETYLNSYRSVHPEMVQMYHDLEKQARENKYIRMLTGRVRHYNGSEFYGKDGQKPSPYHKASSNMVQGSVGEVMRLASMAIDQQLGYKVWQLLHVHDMVLLEVEENDVETIQQVTGLMCLSEINGQPLSVPLRVDIKVGNRWSDLRPLET